MMKTHRKGNNHVEAYNPLGAAVGGDRGGGAMPGAVAHPGDARRRARHTSRRAAPRRRLARRQDKGHTTKIVLASITRFNGKYLG